MSRAGRTILVVDDSPSVRLYHTVALGLQGHTCLAAADGAAGLALLRDRPVDLILLDLCMEGMGGAEFVDRVRALGGRAIPVILISSSDEVDMRAVARGGPGVMVLGKPVPPPVLVAAVDRLLGASDRPPSAGPGAASRPTAQPPA